MRTLIYLSLLLSTIELGCTSNSPRMTGDRITMQKPVIKNLNDVDQDFKKLTHSLVRLRITDVQEKSDSYGTAFFFQTRDLLVTSQHLFNPKHECLTQLHCRLNIGFVKDSQSVTEHVADVQVILKHPTKDLIFLKLTNDDQFVDIKPLKIKAKNNQGPLTAAGFYHDNPALTFSQGQTLETTSHNTTSILVSSGFSGSPILNKQGEIVGVVSSYKPLKGENIGLAQYTTLSEEN